MTVTTCEICAGNTEWLCVDPHCISSQFHSIRTLNLSTHDHVTILRADWLVPLSFIFSYQLRTLLLLHSHDPQNLIGFAIRQVSSDHKYRVSYRETWLSFDTHGDMKKPSHEQLPSCWSCAKKSARYVSDMSSGPVSSEFRLNHWVKTHRNTSENIIIIIRWSNAVKHIPAGPVSVL